MSDQQSLIFRANLGGWARETVTPLAYGGMIWRVKYKNMCYETTKYAQMRSTSSQSFNISLYEFIFFWRKSYPSISCIPVYNYDSAYHSPIYCSDRGRANSQLCSPTFLLSKFGWNPQQQIWSNGEAGIRQLLNNMIGRGEKVVNAWVFPKKIFNILIDRGGGSLVT